MQNKSSTLKCHVRVLAIYDRFEIERKHPDPPDLDDSRAMFSFIDRDSGDIHDIIFTENQMVELTKKLLKVWVKNEIKK